MAKPAEEQTSNNKITYQSKKILDLSANWKVQFDTAFGGPDQPMKFDSLTSWTNNPDSSIKYYSGTAFYQQSFSLPSLDANQNNYNIQLEGVHDIVEVVINENSCGTAWTYPYQLNISNALRKGNNDIVIKVNNTWHNRLIYDNSSPRQQRVTWTNAPFRLQGQPLAPAGITESISIYADSKN